MKHLASTVALMGCLYAGSASAATYFTDFFDFVAEFSVTTTTSFSGPVVAPFAVTSPNGSVSTGKWRDVIDNDNGPTVWSFASPINGFGGFFDLAGPGGQGSGIKVTLGLVGGGTEVLDEISNTVAGTFWGFITDVAFNTVTFSEGSDCCVETYTLDNLTIGNNLAPVPLPASLGLLGLAVGGVAAFGRKRRT